MTIGSRFRRPLHFSIAVAFALLFILHGGAANAVLFQGSFKGIAFGTSTYPVYPVQGNFDGQTVTGTFSFNTSNQGEFGEPYPGTDYVSYLPAPGTMSITVHADGRTLDYSDTLRVMLYKSTTEQYILLTVGIDVLFQGISLILAGPLFDDFFDLESLHAGPVDLGNSIVGFNQGRYFAGAAHFTEVTFDGVPVPEPQSLSLVLGAIAAAMAGRVIRNHD